MLERWSTLWRNLALTLIGALVLWFAWSVRAALNPLLIGWLLAYMLHPLVLALERRGWSRQLAVNVIFVSFLVGVVVMLGAVFLQGRSLWQDVSREDGALARIEESVTEAITDLEARLVEWGVIETPPTVEGEAEEPRAAATMRQLFEALRQWMGGEAAQAQRGQAVAAAGGFLAIARKIGVSVLTFFGYLILVPIYTWFLLFELERIATFIQGYIPVSQRERFSRIGRQITEMLSNFLRGRLLVCLLKGLALALLLFIARVPYALVLGLMTGFLSLIPFVGSLIGYATAFLLGLLEFSPLSAGIRVVIVSSLGEVLENYVFIPKILGDSLGLHPVVVLACVMIGGVALGFFGFLLALPLAATVIILARELVLPALRDLAEGRSSP
ncbi:MAG TPA: AI-2E family transporter [Planctomycetota bacterium]|nr:AI-2E family transporter [Planctomycetota bacterium]